MIGMVSKGGLIHRTEIGTEQHRRPWLLELFSTGLFAEEYIRSHGRLVQEVMTTDRVSVDDTTPLSEVATMLEKEGIKHVPALRNGHVVGVLSRANLV